MFPLCVSSLKSDLAAQTRKSEMIRIGHSSSPLARSRRPALPVLEQAKSLDANPTSNFRECEPTNFRTERELPNQQMSWTSLTTTGRAWSSCVDLHVGHFSGCRSHPRAKLPAWSWRFRTRVRSVAARYFEQIQLITGGGGSYCFEDRRTRRRDWRAQVSCCCN